jgi:hypothetical protein
MGGQQRYPDGRPPPLDERWPGVEQAGRGPLRLDPDGLRRALGPLLGKLDELNGAGKGSLRDIRDAVGRARGGGAWGVWLTADRVNGFHGSVVDQYLACYRELLRQVAQVVEVVGRNVHTTTGADAQVGQRLADIRDQAAGIAVPAGSGAAVAPVGADGSFD